MPEVLVLTKNLDSAPTPTEIKQNLLQWIFLVKIFVSFVKFLNVSLDEYRLFLSHVKQVFLMIIASEQKRLY